MSNSLLVPIELDVLMANDAQINQDKFLWWDFNYSSLANDSFESPESFGVYPSKPSTQPSATNGPGAYLHWTLPRTLRSSHPDDTTKYPLVPNRWLVVRTYEVAGVNKSTGWVVQSDCPNEESSTVNTPFLVDSSVIQNWKNSSDPARTSAAATYITNQWQYNILKSAPGYTENDYTDTFQVTLGKVTDLSSWEEKTKPADGTSFLTAVAPGNLAYTAYYPHCSGMFTYYDDLAHVPKDAAVSYFVTGWYSDPTTDIIATGDNSFTGASTIADVLKALNWTMAIDPATGKPADPGTIDRSLYTGMSFQMQWNGEVAANDELADTANSKHVNVSIGNSDIDAFTTLIEAQLTGTSKYTTAEVAQYVKLLRAFQYDLLPELNKVNGEALLNQKNANKWFQSKYGGTEWTITVENDGPIGTNEAGWLATLNQDQKAYDESLQKLFDLQWELNTAWYKYGLYNASIKGLPNRPANIPKDFGTTLENELDSSKTTGVLAKLMSHFDTVAAAGSKVPQPAQVASNTAQENLQAGIASFAAGKKLPANMTLKAVNKPAYWTPNNPNIVVSGIKSPPIANPNDALVVRNSAQAITEFTIDNTTVSFATVPGIAPALSFTAGHLNADIVTLYQEFGLLNPANAALIATALGIKSSDLSSFMESQSPATNYKDNEALPTNSKADWIQDWAPLYMDWKITYAQIPYEYGSTPKPNWTFDGSDYNLIDSPAGIQENMGIQGRSLLSPHIQFTLGDKLNSFLAEYAAEEADLSALYKEIESLDSWAFLSQELTHLNTYFTQRDPRPFRRPTSEMTYNGTTNDTVSYAELSGFANSPGSGKYITPSHVQGLVNTIPAIQPGGNKSNYNFHPIRAAQAYISELYIYDRFGRTLTLIDDGSDSPLTSPDDFLLWRDKAMTVPKGEEHIKDISKDALKPTIASPFQMPPRLLQPARLDMLLVDHTTTAATKEADLEVLGQVKGVNPICGWLIPNHLDQSLMLFDNTGGNLGQLSLAVPTDSSTTVVWKAPIGNNITYNTVAEITAAFPEFGAFISGMVGNSPAEFGDFMGAIDSTLWTTAPLGRRSDQNLSVLIGRPLALTRVMLQFMLDGAAITSQDWPEPASAPAPLDANVPDFTTSNFGIRLGDLATREDGVIGYFTGTDYSVFNSVAAPLSKTNYVSEIGPLPNAADKTPAGTNFINLPFDGKTKQFVSILVDPRAAMHAITGIFPARKLEIPKEFVDPVLSKISLYFRSGPLLTKVSAAKPGATYSSNISYLSPSEKNGEWSWWEKDQSTWTGYGLEKASFTEGDAAIKDGYLRFDTDLE